MKIVLSKKGLDSGNSNSPIIFPQKGEKMIFVPIITDDENDKEITKKLKYKFINKNNFVKKEKTKFCINYSINNGLEDKKISVSPAFHVDPQLKNYFGKKYDDSFVASFGPLHNLDVKVNDIFLFFGWYEGDVNAFWGYMQIGEIIKEKTKEKDIEKTKCLKNQPHWLNNKYIIYIASPTLKDDNGGKDIIDDDGKICKGFGFFKYEEDKDLILTEQNKSKGSWKIEGLKNVKITNYKNQSFDDEGCTKIATVGHRQDFILDEKNDVAKKWAINLIKKYGEKM